MFSRLLHFLSSWDHIKLNLCLGQVGHFVEEAQERSKTIKFLQSTKFKLHHKNGIGELEVFYKDKMKKFVNLLPTIWNLESVCIRKQF